MELWARNCPVILPKFRLPRKFTDLSHAANLRHGTDGFTSPPKEGVLRIFYAQKIRRLRPGLNPRTWVLKASTLPLDHRMVMLYVLNKIRVKKMALRILFVGNLTDDRNGDIECFQVSVAT